jgi:photosystem II stability/assembly factor-like uncharacterized protein
MTFALTLFLALNIPPVSTETPNKQPQLAASKDTVAMVFGSNHAVMFSKSSDGGATFSKPTVIADVPALMAGRHRGPRVAITGNTILVTAISGGEAGNLLLWRSTDSGQTWSKPVTVNDVPHAAREGLHAMTADDSGHAAAVWLDLRAKGTRLYGAFSNDAGATWSKNVAVYESPEGTICQCCHPTLSAAGNGEFAVMFRNALAGSRDMYLLKIRDGQVTAKAQKLGLDTWQLNACPMDGGGVAIDNGRLITAWRRDKDIYLAEPGQKESRIGTGMDPALAASHGTTYAIWNHAGAIEASVAGKTETLATAGGAFPTIVALPSGGALAAWEENGKIELRRLAK